MGLYREEARSSRGSKRVGQTFGSGQVNYARLVPPPASPVGHSRWFCLPLFCRSRFHLPTFLRSTVVTRFIATMNALTPALHLPAPRQVSLITEPALQDIPSPTTPCAPSRQYLLLRSGLAAGSRFIAPGGSSDFVHCSQSHQSHQAVSSSCRGPFWPVRSTDYPLVSSCSPHRVAGMQLLSTRGGKLRHRGTSTLQCMFPLKRTSAAFTPLQWGKPFGSKKAQPPLRLCAEAA